MGYPNSHCKNVVAFSGGVDSSLVAYLVHQAFPGNSMACLGVSASLPVDQLMLARRVAGVIGIPLQEVSPGEGEHEEYVANQGRSCYQCKVTAHSGLHVFGCPVLLRFGCNPQRRQAHLYTALEVLAASLGGEQRLRGASSLEGGTIQQGAKHSGGR